MKEPKHHLSKPLRELDEKEVAIALGNAMITGKNVGNYPFTTSKTRLE